MRKMTGNERIYMGRKRQKGVQTMRAAIFTIDTGAYKAKGRERGGVRAESGCWNMLGFEVKAAGLLPQEREVVAAVMRQLSDSGSVELILTTGARPGYMEDDCAPDALAEVADRLLPGDRGGAARVQLCGTRRNPCWSGCRRGSGTEDTDAEPAGERKDGERGHGVYPAGARAGCGESELMIRVTYLGHSGFLVETDRDMYFLFDYYKGVVPADSMKDKENVWCSSSHAHYDHYGKVDLRIFERTV